ncbi:MAG: hypothetical protein R8K46_04945, partial [Mariprofundaceae bacterium]
KVCYREPEQMRHIFASMVLTAGENIAWVSRQLGLKPISTTLKKYARWIPSDGERATAISPAVHPPPQLGQEADAAQCELDHLSPMAGLTDGVQPHLQEICLLVIIHR